MSLQVGFGTLSCQVPVDDKRSVAQTYEEILDLAQLAEAVGFDSIWFSEHHGAANSHLPSPVVMLAAVAAVTERIKLGSAMVLAPFQHPLRFAEDCAVADQISRGRLMVGVASGWLAEEFTAFGVPISERAPRTAELVAICRAAWDNERFTHDGRYFSFDDVRLTPRPAGDLPIFLGGSAPRAVERAGRLADGYIGTGTPHMGLNVFRERIAAFDDAARAAGRDPLQLPIGFHVNAWVSDSGAVPTSVLSAMWHQIGSYLSWHTSDHSQSGGGNVDLPPVDEPELRRRGFLGNPQEVVAQARPWIEAFAGRPLHVLFRIHYPGLDPAEVEPAVRLFATEVIPALKAIADR